MLLIFSFNLDNQLCAQGTEAIDSLLLELSKLENQSGPDILSKKAELNNEIADLYNLYYSDQDHSRLYLLQAISVLEEKIKMTVRAAPNDLLFLSDLYRKLSLFEAFRGNRNTSDQYIDRCETQLKKLKGLIPEAQYTKAIFDFYHSCFGLRFSLGNYASAMDYADKAYLILLNNSELAEWEANLLSEKSICYSQLGEHDKAVEFGKRALDVYYLRPLIDQPEDRFVYFYIKALYLAKQYGEINQFVETDPNYHDLKSMEAYLLKNRELASRSFFELVFLIGKTNVMCFEETGDSRNLAKAYEWYINGFYLVEKLTLINEGEKIGNSLLKPKDKIIGLLNLVDLGLKEQVIPPQNIFEIIRILDVYQSNRLHVERLSSGLNQANWAQEKVLKNECIHINTQLAELGTKDEDKLIGDSLTNRFNGLTEEWQALKRKNKRDQVLREYSLSKDDFARYLKSTLLSQNKTLLTYFYSDVDSVVYIIGMTSTMPIFESIKLDVDLNKKITAAYQLNAKLQIDPGQLETQHALNKYLYSVLIQPIKEDLTTESLLLYPLNELSFVSFDALLDTENDYLVQEFNIQYTSSLYSIILNQRGVPKNPNVTCFKPSNFGSNNRAALNEAEQEVAAINEVFNSKIYLDEAANKAQFLQLKTANQIIHIASHSVLDQDHPYESYILFDAGHDTSDYRLYAHEIFGLNIRSPLVVLSTCNSGNGSVEEGIGAISLANAFTFAGVPATLSSLWNAQDLSSSEIMIEFYKQLKLGKTKSESLRTAKMGYLEKADKLKRQPFFWANYVVYGADDPLFEKSEATKWYNYLIGIVLTIALIFIGKRYFNSFNKT